MSIKDLQKKVSLIVCLMFLGSMVVGFFRQIRTYYQLKKRLAEKQKELAVLEEVNEKMKKRGEQITKETPSFNLANDEEEKQGEEKIPNYQKWLGLFFK